MTYGHGQPELTLVPIDRVQPCPIQPRVNVAVDFIDRLSRSIKSGRLQPLLEVEPAPGRPGYYQIVCGEQRWRAAKAVGLLEILVRIHPHLGYLERLERQYEENRLRAALDVVEEAHCLLLDKTIRDTAVAEQLLRESLVPFQPLDEIRIVHREQFAEHLDGLRKLLVKHKVHVVKGADGKPQVGPLSPWRETENALGISETRRKAKLTALNLAPELLDQAREMPAEHAIQIARLQDADRQAELVRRGHDLTVIQVSRIVDRLLQDSSLDVTEMIDAEVDREKTGVGERLSSPEHVGVLADLCRQLTRQLSNLRSRIDEAAAAQVRAILADLRRELDAFEEAA